MKISELKANQGRVNLDADVLDIGEAKSFMRFGRVIRVANAKIKDDSGETSLTLWNEEIDKIKPKSKVRITNGFVKEFQGELTVTAGKFGQIEVLDKEEKEEKAEKAGAKRKSKTKKAKDDYDEQEREADEEEREEQEESSEDDVKEEKFNEEKESDSEEEEEF